MADDASTFLIARNPDGDSTLPYLLRVPLEGGILLKARDRWPTTARRRAWSPPVRSPAAAAPSTAGSRAVLRLLVVAAQQVGDRPDERDVLAVALHHSGGSPSGSDILTGIEAKAIGARATEPHLGVLSPSAVPLRNVLLVEARSISRRLHVESTRTLTWRPTSRLQSVGMSISSLPSPESQSPWIRRSSAELLVRETISGDQRLNIFASAWRADSEEAVVLITARDEGARAVAQSLLSNVADADWVHGWRQLDLGDALIELRPERAPC